MTNEENNTPEEENVTPESQEENIVDIGEAIENGQKMAEEISAEEQIADLQKQLLEARDRTMRALAEGENTRKRAMKDRDDAGKYAVANFARDMLAFGDNFARALAAMPEDTPPAVAKV